MTKWKTIDTAPMDGTRIIGYCDEEIYENERVKETWMGKHVKGSIDYDKWIEGLIPRNAGWVYIKRECIHYWKPTHWMPLPNVENIND